MRFLTEFQKRVYAVVKKIPRGQVLTYQEVAVKLGNQGLARAIGNALNKNKNPMIPCHRVIRSDGGIGGYNRGSLEKIKILKKEGVKISKNKILEGRTLWIRGK